MSTANPFDLLGDDDNDDLSLLLAAQQKKLAAALKSAPPASDQAKPAKLPTKPLPPSQPVREARNDGGRGGRGGGRGYGRGHGGPGGFNRDSNNSETTFGSDNGTPYKPSEEREAGRPYERRPNSGARGAYRGGGRRGGYSNDEAGEGERARRTYDRHSGYGMEQKRDGAGRGNWGTPTDEISQEIEEPAAESETNAVAIEKQLNEGENVDTNKENPSNESEEKEAEEKQMTLEEYEKVLEEKRKALLALKVEERKVDTKDFETMQVISKKKDNEEIFIKLGSDKDKRKEVADKEERAKKSVSINEFLKPAEGEAYYRGGGRGGRGRGRGPRGGGFSGGRTFEAPAPSIADPGHFPLLGAK